MIVVNSSTRQFSIPGADLVFGVESDAGSEVKQFQCPRIVGNNLDLTGCFIRMNWRNANGDVDSYLVQDVVVEGDNVTFSWELSQRVTQYKGQVRFVMCVTGPDTKLKWHTTLGAGQVLEGLEPDSTVIEAGTADVVAQLIQMVEDQTAAVQEVGETWVENVETEGATQVQNVRTAASESQAASVAQIEAKGVAVLADIPVDYTALSKATNEQANAVKGKLSGAVVRADDVSPVEHTMDVVVKSKNLLPFPYANISYTGNGVTFSAGEDGSIALAGTPTGYTNLGLYRGVPLRTSGEITISVTGGTNVVLVFVMYDGDGNKSVEKEARDGNPVVVNLNEHPVISEWLIHVKRKVDGVEMTGVLYPQIEEGNTASEYTPYVDPTTVTLKRCGKNLLPRISGTQTGKGITYTVNTDGSVTANGTATANATFPFFEQEYFPPGKYRLTGTPESVGSNAIRFQANLVRNGVASSGAIDMGTGSTLTVTEDDLVTVYIVVLSGQTVDNVTFYPMLRQLDMPDGYEESCLEEYTPNSTGIVGGVTSVSPTMTLLTDKTGVTVECEYNRDTNKVIADLYERIAALSGV